MYFPKFFISYTAQKLVIFHKIPRGKVGLTILSQSFSLIVIWYWHWSIFLATGFAFWTEKRYFFQDGGKNLSKTYFSKLARRPYKTSTAGRIMYISFIFLLSWLCVTSAQITYDRSYQGIHDMTVYTIPVGSERVWFQGNSLTTVPADYFVNLPNLYLIYLYSNSISNVGAHAFAGVPNVTEISLEHNDLSLIHENMFVHHSIWEFQGEHGSHLLGSGT